MTRFALAALLAFGYIASEASAQDMIKNTAKRAGVGGSYGAIITIDEDVNVGPAWGFNFGLAPEPGLGPTVGFGWYEGDLTLNRVAGDVEIGRLRVRPVMAGIAYTWVSGRWATGVSLNAGVSFNSIRLNDQLRNLFPGTQIDVDSSNSFCVRPQIRVEYAVARKVGIFSSAGFFFTEFDNEINTPVGRFENEWDASSFNVFVGVMVYPFK
jgi:hypothetical protein